MSTEEILVNPEDKLFESYYWPVEPSLYRCIDSEMCIGYLITKNDYRIRCLKCCPEKEEEDK